MIRPEGPTKVNSRLAFPVMRPPAAVDEVMVVEAQEREVVEVRAPVRFPGHHVVGVGERRVRAPGEPAVAVSAHDLPALGVGRFPPGPALVHRVAHVVVDTDRDRGVACDSSDGLAADEPVSLQLAGQLRSPRLTRRPGPPAAHGPRRSTGSTSSPRARADERIIPMKPSQRRWSHGVSPSEGIWRARAWRQARVSA